MYAGVWLSVSSTEPFGPSAMPSAHTIEAFLHQRLQLAPAHAPGGKATVRGAGDLVVDRAHCLPMFAMANVSSSAEHEGWILEDSTRPEAEARDPVTGERALAEARLRGELQHGRGAREPSNRMVRCLPCSRRTMGTAAINPPKTPVTKDR